VIERIWNEDLRFEHQAAMSYRSRMTPWRCNSWRTGPWWPVRHRIRNRHLTAEQPIRSHADTGT